MHPEQPHLDRLSGLDRLGDGGQQRGCAPSLVQGLVHPKVAHRRQQAPPVHPGAVLVPEQNLRFLPVPHLGPPAPLELRIQDRLRAARHRGAILELMGELAAILIVTRRGHREHSGIVAALGRVVPHHLAPARRRGGGGVGDGAPPPPPPPPPPRGGKKFAPPRTCRKPRTARST